MSEEGAQRSAQPRGKSGWKKSWERDQEEPREPTDQADGRKQDPAVAAAPRKVASRYYQMKMGHAAVGEFMQRRNAQISAECCWCQAPKESVGHLLFECREWRKQRRTLRGDLIRAKVQYPTAAEEIPE